VSAVSSPQVVTPEWLLKHWQGHRALTRRVIEAFPEDKLFTYSVGGMRPFGALAMELLAMAAPMARAIVSREQEQFAPPEVQSREALLRRWDEDTAEIDRLWPRIPIEAFQEVMTVFDTYTSQGIHLLMYVIDNEIHHRGQGYVYLRSLGIEPPPFWERE
jgi:uncharacterized damage-inducible protein DinB